MYADSRFRVSKRNVARCCSRHDEVRELADLRRPVVGANHAGVAAVLAVETALGLSQRESRN